MAELIAVYSPPMPSPATNLKNSNTSRFHDKPARPLPIR